MSQKICGIPFSEITIQLDTFNNNNLVIVPCCSALICTPFSKFLIKVDEDEDNNFDILKKWNCNEIKEFRKSIIDGSYRFCRLCACPNWIPNKLEPVPPEAIPYIEKKELHLDYPPRLIRVGIDMACNLCCPSCRVEKKLLPDPKTYKRLLSIFSSGVKNIYISGSGEIFINQYIMQAFHDFSCKKYPDIEGFFLVTNGLAFNKTNWYILSSDFKKMIKDIWISIDTANPDTYKVLRRGGDFSILKKNLNFISKLRENGEIKKFTLTFVLQKKNIHELSQFVEFAKEVRADKVVLNKIEHFGHQNITYFEKEMALPENWKTKYKDDIDLTLDLLKEYDIELISNVIG